MLFPRLRTWTPTLKGFIIGAVLVGLLSLGALVYTYERYHRGPTDSVFFGTWQMEDGCMDCTNLITFQSNHDVIAFGDYLGREDELDYRGRWYAGGEQLIIQYDDGGEGRLIVMKIQEITPNAIRVSWGGTEMRLTRSRRTPPQASNRRCSQPRDCPRCGPCGFAIQPLRLARVAQVSRLPRA
jgi:hypothetical protein